MVKFFTVVFKSLNFLNNIIEDKTALLILCFLNEWDLKDNNESICNKCQCFMKCMFLAHASHVFITIKISPF